MSITPPLKWHGGKHYLARQIINLMPPRDGWLHYVEPYFGGGSVLLANNPHGISEVANDLNGALVNFWLVLRDTELFPQFLRKVTATPFSEYVYWQAAQHRPELRNDSVDDALAFFIHCRQSLAGRMAGFSGITKTRVRRGMNNEVSAWLSCIHGLPEVHARLQRVLITNRPALEIVEKHDGPETLFYLDPPYLHETRATTGEYAHEMSDGEHSELLATLARIRGRFMLSGYPSNLYHVFAERYGWRCVTFDLPNNAASGASKQRQTEAVWLNY